MVFHVGKATKRSRFGERVSVQVGKTLESAEFCIKSNFDFHFIDAEWTQNYPHANEIDRLLTYSEERAKDLTTIFTVNARHSVAFDVFDEASEVIAQHGNAGFCFVAGNPAYLTAEERQLDAKSRLANLVRISKDRAETAPVFIGAEGQSELASELAGKYDAIPFMLLDESILDRISELKSRVNNGIGVYCPYLLSSDTDERRVRSLGLYALRRRWVRESLRRAGIRPADVRAQIREGQTIDDTARGILIEALKTLALCDKLEFQDQLARLTFAGAKYATFLPAIESVEENEKLSDLISDSRS